MKGTPEKVGLKWSHKGPGLFTGRIGPIGPPRKIGKILAFFRFFRPTQKMGPESPKRARGDFCPTNPDLADILGRTDLDFENFYFFHFFGVPNF